MGHDHLLGLSARQGAEKQVSKQDFAKNLMSNDEQEVRIYRKGGVSIRPPTLSGGIPPVCISAVIHTLRSINHLTSACLYSSINNKRHPPLFFVTILQIVD